MKTESLLDTVSDVLVMMSVIHLFEFFCRERRGNQHLKRKRKHRNNEMMSLNAIMLFSNRNYVRVFVIILV